MKFARADFRKLQPSTFVAVLMFAVGAAAVYVSYNAGQTAEKARQVVSAQRQEADLKLQQVRDEESEVKQKSIVFKQLQERGIIGEEQRLEWVELLKDIRDQRRLIDLSYDISPQRLLDGGPVGDFAFHASSMKLELKLLHEEDLTRLLRDLQQQAKALIRVNSCKVERLPPTADERADSRANLLADCEIDWLTLRDAGRK